MRPRRVVITGLGLVTPVGIGAEAVWNALLEKRGGVKRITAFDQSQFPSQLGGQIESLVVSNYVPKAYRKSTKVMARDIEIAVAAAHEAAKDAGLKTKCLVERGEVEGPSNWTPPASGPTSARGSSCADLCEPGRGIEHGRGRKGASSHSQVGPPKA